MKKKELYVIKQGLIKKDLFFFLILSLSLSLVGCTSKKLMESPSSLEPIVTKPFEVNNFMRVSYSYDSDSPCSEIEFLKKHVGTKKGQMTIDNIIDIHKYEIEEVTSLGLLTLSRKYKCDYWGIGVEYSSAEEE